MNAISLLEEVYENLSEKTWCKGSLMNREGKMCLAGQLGAAFYGTEVRHGVKQFLEPERNGEERAAYMQAWNALDSVIFRETRCATISFNDMEPTSLEDVKLMVKKAIGDLEMKEAN